MIVAWLGQLDSIAMLYSLQEMIVVQSRDLQNVPQAMNSPF